MRKRQRKFPATVNVHFEHDDGDPDDIMLIDEDVADIADGSRVAVYTLREIKIKRETHTLEKR